MFLCEQEVEASVVYIKWKSGVGAAYYLGGRQMEAPEGGSQVEAPVLYKWEFGGAQEPGCL